MADDHDEFFSADEDSGLDDDLNALLGEVKTPSTSSHAGMFCRTITNNNKIFAEVLL
jgi:hypothetical protein